MPSPAKKFILLSLIASLLGLAACGSDAVSIVHDGSVGPPVDPFIPPGTDGGDPWVAIADNGTPSIPPPGWDGGEPYIPPPGADGGPDVVPGSREEFCMGGGPTVIVGDHEIVREVCTGQIAETVFLHALCTCNDAQMGGYIQTYGFDSAQNPSEQGWTEGGGAVGINRTFELSVGYTAVGGAFTVAGAESLDFVGYLEVAGDMRLAGEASVLGYAWVARDAWLAGDYSSLGPLEVERDLHRAGRVMAIPLWVEGQNIQEPIDIAEPCPCGEEELLDVGAIVDQGRERNDNAVVGLSASALTDVFWEAELSLPCGRFYLEEISGLGNIVINVEDRVALMVEGSVEAAGNLEFRLAPGAEMDIFIRGNLVLVGAGSFGDRDRPAATRIYVGGDGDVVLVGAAGFVGNVYAPRSLVTAVGYAEVFGSLFAGDLVVPGYTRVLYDVSITRAGEECEEPHDPYAPEEPLPCQVCGVCTGGTACVDGLCGPCDHDGDCCPPLICSQGSCQPHVIIDPDHPAPCDVCTGCTGGLACINGYCMGCKADDDCCYPAVCVEGLCENR